MARNRPPEGATKRARQLRNNPTEAETRLWALLRENFKDFHFRRQVSLRRFNADFAGHQLKLVIEADGGQYADADERCRTQLIEAEGYRILRFWNHDILGNSDGVLFAISQAIHQGHPTQPSPSRGGLK